MFAVDVNYVYNVVFIDWVPLAKKSVKASTPDTSVLPANSYEGQYTRGCLSQRSMHEREQSNFTVNMLVDKCQERKTDMERVGMSAPQQKTQ